MSDTWVTKTAPPQAKLRGLWERQRSSDYILALSGNTTLPADLKVPHRYNVPGDSWSALATMPVGLDHVNAAGWLPDLGVFVVIGALPTTAGTVFRVWLYDPVADSWSAEKASKTPTLDPANFTGVAVPDTNTVHRIAGTEHHIYNAASDTWTTGAARPTSRTYARSAYLDGLLYVHGGSVGPVGELHAYDPVGDTWTTLATGPVMSQHGMTAAGGYLWVVDIDGSPFSLYNPSTDTWTTKTSPGALTGGPRLAGRGGKVYLLAGDTSGPLLREYTPDVVMAPDDPVILEGWGIPL